MNANTHEVKVTDDIEREMIQREIDDLNHFAGVTTEPFTTWLLAAALAVGSLFILITVGSLIISK